MWHACPHHTNNKSEEGKTKTKPKKAMKTGNNTLSLPLPLLFYEESICLVSLSALANYKNCCYKQKREVCWPCPW